MAQLATQLMTDAACLKSLLGAVGAAERLLIMPHNDPDPDAIASAAALDYVVRGLTAAKTTIGYGGIVGRAENRALVSYLQAPLQKIATIDCGEFDLIALVDSQPGAGNNLLPADRKADIVIDHHQPLREQTSRAAHVDVRFDAGATSTILTGYVVSAGSQIPPRLATALYYGIQTDTLGLGKRANPTDRAAYTRLQSLVETDELAAIQHAQVRREYFRAFEQALRTAEVYGSAVVAHLGETYRPDMAAEMADVLLRLEGTRWVMCSGFHNETLFLSLRSTRVNPGAGQVAQAVVQGLGMAGGHGTVGGGQAPVRGWDKEALVVEVRRRFLAALGLQDQAAQLLID